MSTEVAALGVVLSYESVRCQIIEAFLVPCFVAAPPPLISVWMCRLDVVGGIESIAAS